MDSPAHPPLHRLTLFAVYTAILYFSFAHDAFAVLGNRSEASLFDTSSHAHDAYIGSDSYLVLNRLQLASDGKVGAWAPLGDYYSQVGLQGIILSAIQQAAKLESIGFGYVAARFFALLTAMLLAAFFVSVARIFGSLSAGVGVLLTACSPILLRFAPSLFWATPLLFAPFVLVWCFEPWFACVRFGGLCRYGMIFSCVLLKALCGYEFITTVILSPIAAIAFHRVYAGTMSRRFIGTAALVCLVGCAAFGAAIGMHVVQLNNVDDVRARYPDGGWSVIVDRAKMRTINEATNELSLAEISSQSILGMSESNSYKLRALAHYRKMPAIATPRTFPLLRFHIRLDAILIFSAAFAATAAVWRCSSPRFRGLAFALIVGIAASLSWQFAALNHSSVHFHLNQIVFQMPFLPLAYVAVGYTLQSLLSRIRVGNPIAALVPTTIAILLVGVVLSRDATSIRQSDEKSNWSAVNRFLDGQAPMEEAHLRGSVDCQHFIGKYGGDEMGRSTLLGDNPDAGSVFLIIGWAADEYGPRGKKLWLDAPRQRVSIVVIQAGHVIPSRVSFFDRPDLERAIGVKGVGAGFELMIAGHYVEKEKPLRLFLVSQSDRSRVCELPLPPRQDVP